MEAIPESSFDEKQTKELVDASETLSKKLEKILTKEGKAWDDNKKMKLRH